MDDRQFLEYHKECCDKLQLIVSAKNHDYAGFDRVDAFANFTLVEKAGITSVEAGFLTRMMDKIARVSSFVKQGVIKVDTEKIEDTLLDLANYSILMAGYIKSKKENNGTDQT